MGPAISKEKKVIFIIGYFRDKIENWVKLQTKKYFYNPNNLRLKEFFEN